MRTICLGHQVQVCEAFTFQNELLNNAPDWHERNSVSELLSSAHEILLNSIHGLRFKFDNQ